MREKIKEFGVIALWLLVGYSLIALVGFLHSSNSLTGFAISESTEKDASLALGKASQIIEDMQKLGFKVSRMKDLLQEARTQTSLGNYEQAVAISNEISELRQKAFDVRDKIKNATAIINNFKKYGLNATEADTLLSLSVIEFALENYESAEDFAQKSTDMLDVFANEELNIIIQSLTQLKNVSMENGLNITRLQSIISDAQNALEPDIRKINALRQELDSLSKSINELIEANNEIKAMTESGLGVNRFNNLLNEAKFALELGYYNKIKEITNNIRSLKSKALQLDDSIKKTRAKIDEAKSYGLDINETESLLNSAISEFGYENYEEAEKLLRQSFEKAEKLLADYLLFGAIPKKELLQNIINFLKRFWWLVLIISALITFFSTIIFQKISIMLLQISLKNLEREKEAITSLIKNAQNAYFKERTMDKSTYELTIEKHQDRLIEIKERMPVINGKLARKKEKAFKLSKLKEILGKKQK